MSEYLHCSEIIGVYKGVCISRFPNTGPNPRNAHAEERLVG